MLRTEWFGLMLKPRAAAVSYVLEKPFLHEVSFCYKHILGAFLLKQIEKNRVSLLNLFFLSAKFHMDKCKYNHMKSSLKNK